MYDCIFSDDCLQEIVDFMKGIKAMKKEPLCKDCGENNPNNFYRCVKNRCIECQKKYCKDYYKNHKEKAQHK